jgi:hypothetical protein
MMEPENLERNTYIMKTTITLKTVFKESLNGLSFIEFLMHLR